MVTGYKQTELGIIPNDWNVELLGNIASPKARIGWQNLRKDEFLDSGDFMLITGTDFENGKINYKICKYVSKERYLQDENIQVKNGDILITKDGTLGKVAFVQELHMPATLNAGVFVLTGLSNEVNNRFLYQYLCTEKLMMYAEKTSTGGTIQHLNQGVLVNFPIPIPPLKEQKRIAQSLFDMDTLIAKSEQAIKKYRALKQTCLQHMFPRAGQTEPDIRLPGFTGPWEQRKLPDLLKKSTGAMKIGPFGSALKKDIYVSRGIKVYAQENIFKDDFSIGNYYITENKYKELQSCELFPGDIVISMMGTIGACAVFPEHAEKGIMNSHLLRLQFGNDMLPEFVKLLLRDVPSIKIEMKKLSVGTIMTGLSSTVIKKLNLPVTYIEEQKKISAFFKNLDNLITLHQRTCEKYKKIKQGMMEELLSGKIRLV